MKENDPLLLKWRALGPSAPPHERRELFSAIVRAEMDAAALTGDDEPGGGLALSIECKMDALTGMAARPPPDLAAFEQGFHDLWYGVVAASRIRAQPRTVGVLERKAARDYQRERGRGRESSVRRRRESVAGAHVARGGHCLGP